MNRIKWTKRKNGEKTNFDVFPLLFISCPFFLLLTRQISKVFLFKKLVFILFNRRARRRLLLLFYKRRAQSIARSSDGFVADLWFQGFQSFGLKQKKKKRVTVVTGWNAHSLWNCLDVHFLFPWSPTQLEIPFYLSIMSDEKWISFFLVKFPFIISMQMTMKTRFILFFSRQIIII